MGARRCSVLFQARCSYSLLSVSWGTGCDGAEGRNTTLGRMNVVVLCCDRFIFTFLRIHKDCLSRVAQLSFTHWPKSA